jgi:hypothetical protein
MKMQKKLEVTGLRIRLIILEQKQQEIITDYLKECSRVEVIKIRVLVVVTILDIRIILMILKVHQHG